MRTSNAICDIQRQRVIARLVAAKLLRVMFNDRLSGAGGCFPVDYVLGIEYSKAVAPAPSVSQKMPTNWHETLQEALALAMKQKRRRTLARRPRRGQTWRGNRLSS